MINDFHIHIEALPDHVFDTACLILAPSIRLALHDPEKRKDYEKWIVKRELSVLPKK